MPKQPIAQDLQFAQHPPIRRYPEATFLSHLDVKLTSLLSNVPLSAIPGLTFVPFLYGHLFGQAEHKSFQPFARPCLLAL